MAGCQPRKAFEIAVQARGILGDLRREGPQVLRDLLFSADLPIEIKTDLGKGEALRVLATIEQTQTKRLREPEHVGMIGVDEFPPKVRHEAGTDPVTARKYPASQTAARLVDGRVHPRLLQVIGGMQPGETAPDNRDHWGRAAVATHHGVCPGRQGAGHDSRGPHEGRRLQHTATAPSSRHCGHGGRLPVGLEIRTARLLQGLEKTLEQGGMGHKNPLRRWVVPWTHARQTVGEP